MRRVVAALGVLVLLAAAVLGWLVAREPADGSAEDLSAADSGAAFLASTEVGDEVVAAAEEATARAYTYSWRTLTDDRAAARQLLVAPVVDRYDRTMAGLAPGARRDHRVVTASVVGSGVVHAATTYARVLVFVNQRTTADDLDEPRTDLDRVLVSLTRVDGLWRVSELDAL